MILTLPMSNDPAQTFICQLGDTKYQFTVRFNDRSGTWSMDIADDVTGDYILTGIALLLGQDLLAPYNLGIGRMLVVDNASTGKDAGVDDLGVRVTVVWFSPDEVIA